MSHQLSGRAFCWRRGSGRGIWELADRFVDSTSVQPTHWLQDCLQGHTAAVARVWGGAAVSAAFGQGVNSALEDCTVLAQALAGAAGDVDAALQRYERQRWPDVRALGTMDHQVIGM